MNTFLNLSLEFENDRAELHRQLNIISRLPLLKRIQNRGSYEQQRIALYPNYYGAQRKRATRAGKALWVGYYK